MKENHMKISEFAQVTGISRRNLIFYDEIGLLSPASVHEENKYRYYTYGQVDTANVIIILREVGMSLKEIKNYLQNRSPENLICLFKEQSKIVNEKIKTLMQVSDMLDSRIALTKSGEKADVNKIELIKCSGAEILLGPELPADGHISEGWYYLMDFYEFCRKNKVILGLPTGAIISRTDLEKQNFNHPSCYYYRPECGNNYPHNAQKPRGFYVIGCEYTEYGISTQLYTRLINYINNNNLKIIGDAYEEYLIDEISTPDPTKYLLQIAIQVKYK